MKSQFARDDPAFFVLLIVWLFSEYHNFGIIYLYGSIYSYDLKRLIKFFFNYLGLKIVRKANLFFILLY